MFLRNVSMLLATQLVTFAMAAGTSVITALLAFGVQGGNWGTRWS